VQDLSLVPQGRTPHPARNGSGVAVCPRGSRPAPGAGELWHRHVPRGIGNATRHGRAPVSPCVPRLQTYSRCGRALASPCATGPATRQGRALVSPHVPWLQTHLPALEGSSITTCGRARRPVGKGSGAVMCPVAPDPPLSAGGLWHHHAPHGSHPPRHAHAFPRRMTLGSSWPHQARGAGSALNAYKTSHTVVVLLVTCNRQATMHGDSTSLCNEAATMPGDPSTQRHTMHGRDVAE
jgi:hypothetical protein